jgi:hypothetical protein
MKIQNFRLYIGDIVLSYKYSMPVFSKGNEPFLEFIYNDSDRLIEVTNTVNIVKEILSLKTKDYLIASTIFWKMWKYKDSYRIDFFNNEGLLTSRVITNDNFSINKIEILDSIIKTTVFIPSDVHSFLMNAYLCCRDIGLFLHGAMVTYNCCGLIFSGVSGSGKSTITSLIKEYKNLSIVSDDRILIRFKEQIECFSTPYDWKIERCKNIKTTLGCIFYLKHGNKNIIRTLDTEEKFRYLFTTNLLPFYIPNGILKISYAFDKLLNTTPIYEFTFTPDKSAVEHLFLFLNNNLS